MDRGAEVRDGRVDAMEVGKAGGGHRAHLVKKNAQEIDVAWRRLEGVAPGRVVATVEKLG